jgi:hypothetical protein
MFDEGFKHDVEALFAEGEALRNALLSHDLTDVRFRARQMASIATLLQFHDVHKAALDLMEALGPEGSAPARAFGPAVFALSDALDDVAGEATPLKGSQARGPR